MEKIKYYIAGKAYFSYPIFFKDTICNSCGTRVQVEYEFNQNEATKQCPYCHQEVKIYINL